jgi:ribonuclease-3 family protein
MSNDIISSGALPDAAALRMMSPVTLAFIGDAVFGLLVREHLISTGVFKANTLHRLSVTYVKAGAQAGAVERLQPMLTQEERDILRRGRNANTSRVPKNANPIDYRNATGLEALFGYLYLGGCHERLLEIFKAVIEEKAQADTETAM